MSQPNVWIIDHRDSFTWNLAELVRMTGMAVPRVVSNESPELEQAVQAGEKLILSPGPGTVEDACHRATFRLLDRLPRFTPVLGVCLGHQILGVRFGARLEHLSRPLHGAREVICRTEQCPCNAPRHLIELRQVSYITCLSASSVQEVCIDSASPLQAASRSPQSTVSSSSLATPSRSILSLASASRCITLARSLAG